LLTLENNQFPLLLQICTSRRLRLLI
jgi:hypothetical protein